MYVLNTSKSAVPSIGENVLQRNIKTVTFRTPTAKTLTSNYHNQKWSLKSAPPYKLVEHTKATLLDASKFKDKFLSSVTQMRNFVQSSRQDQMKGQNDGQKPLPRLLYIQNPLVWVTNKIDFRHLRVAMDPSFTEKEFTRGARQVRDLEMFKDVKILCFP
ncbi:unnamed protein product [Nesidiocoris tenuis]|uniref:Uncharacterized protein n=1 Tax=Nesidiocoris tenuis TaxID=355587 RepID=A0A6H5GBN9_9HEMI|nr:unnamed protein product [Nesidiocoris tenuis]